MEFWESGLVLNGLLLAALLAAGAALRMTPPLRKLGIPGSIIGGVLGLVLGPSVLGLVPLQIPDLESLVYHGLAIVFIAVALQTPRPTPDGQRSGGAFSIALSIPFFLSVQAAVGMAVVLAMSLHPGFGLLLALGFEQGPGQALSMGAAWEPSGLTDGGQIGLIIAAIGFGISIFVGVPLAAWGRSRGLTTDLSQFAPLGAGDDQAGEGAADEAGALESLTRQVIAIGVAYLMTYGLVALIGGALFDAGKDGLAHTVFGFHFIVGALAGMLIRTLLNRGPIDSPLDDKLLSRLAGLTVDLVTCGAIAAVQIEVLGNNLVPILTVTLLGGAVTLAGVLWLAPRAFPSAPFEHALLLFGTVTGTLPMGLALLRILDPEMRSPVSINAVLGSAMSIPFAAAFLMGMMPFAISGWPDGYPTTGAISLAIFVVYAAVLLGIWRYFGALRFTAPFSIWPVQPDHERSP